ncbi:MAG: PD-(D/E)XK nuclease family protein, partial [Thermoanaerobacteraceae bacterium]|nr:PD-(D/E)XK nuclease family protein [Thermoanaerobacteraceae bacterium]
IIKYIASYLKQAGDCKPVFFEMGFGYNKKFSFEFAPDILLSGKIDRIDEDSEGRLIIFDYKSGSTPDIQQIEEGTNLQMPLYIMVCEQLLKKPVVGGAFISLKKGSVDNILVRDKNLPFVSKRRKKGILDQAEWDELMSTVKSIIMQYADDIRAAQFTIQPKKCPKTDLFGSFCDFTAICPWEGVD